MASTPTDIVINLLKAIKGNQENPSPTQVERDSIKLSKSNNLLATTNIIVAVVGIGLIIYQVFFADTKVKDFGELLKRQSILISKDSALVDASTAQINALTELNKQLSQQQTLLNDQYSLNVDIFKENKIEWINKKIQGYKKILDIYNKLTYISTKFKYIKWNVLNYQLYPKTIDDYYNFRSEAKSTMDLLTNRFELIFDNSLNKKWDSTYFLFSRDLDFVDEYSFFSKDKEMIFGSPGMMFNFDTGQRAASIKLREYKKYYLIDSMNVILTTSLNEYASDKIKKLNKEMKTLSPKYN